MELKKRVGRKTRHKNIKVRGIKMGCENSLVGAESREGICNGGTA